jgi:hypothetical protein
VSLLTFVVGSPSDVFGGGALASAIDDVLRTRFSFNTHGGEEPYRSDPVDASGWLKLQQRAALAVGGPAVPHLVNVDPYQAVYLPDGVADVEHIPIPNAADPLQVGSVAELLEELRRFAASASLPTDDVELMQLAAHYLESDELFDADPDVQMYVQLMLSAKQAAARKQPLWVVI